MIHSVAYADRVLHDHAVLQNMVRLAQATDDRKQNFSLRYRALLVQPKIQIVDRWGALLRDPGFTSPDIVSSIIKCWQYHDGWIT